MKKWLMLLCVIVVFAAPNVVTGQQNPTAPLGLPPMGSAPVNPGMIPAPPPSYSGSWYPMIWPFNNRRLFSDEMWYTKVYGQIGPQWMNVTFDFPYDGGNVFNLESLTLKLNSEQFWVGYTGIELQPSQDWVVFGRFGALIPKDAEMTMTGTGRAFLPATANTADPNDSPPNLTPPWIWTAKRFNWWLMEGGALYSLSSTLALEAGFRVEHMDFRLEDPRNYTTRLTVPVDSVLTNAIICDRI